MNDLVPFNLSSNPIANNKIKMSNWEKPGGKLGMVFAGLLGAGALMVLYKILPWLITLASNLLTLIGLCVAIAGILWLLTNKDIRRMVSVSYFMFMRKLWGVFVQTNPVAIVKRRIVILKEKMTKIQQLLGKLKGSIKEIERKLKQRSDEFDTAIQEYKIYIAQGKDKEKAAQVVGNKVKSLSDLINTYKENLAQSNKWQDILTKLYEMADLTVQDTEFQVEIRTEQYDQIKLQHATFKSIMSVIKGDPDEAALFMDAMEFMAKDMSNKIGEMEFIIDSAGGLMDQYDMNKLLTSKQASEIISKYDQYGLDGMFENFGDNSVKMIENHINTPYIEVFQSRREAEPILANYANEEQPKRLKSRFFPDEQN